MPYKHFQKFLVDSSARLCFNKNMQTLQIVGENKVEKLVLLEKDTDGNWYTNDNAEEIYISNAELKNKTGTHWEW